MTADRLSTPAHLAPTRRSLIGAAGLLATAAAVPAIASIATGDHTLAELEAELTRVAAWERRLEVGSHSEVEWSGWEAAHDAILAKIESLPATRQNAAIKARAVAIIYLGDEPFEDHRTTDYRLLRQVISAFAGEA